MEYDIEIKVSKLVRGKGLCEQLAGNGNNDLNDDVDVVSVLLDDEQPVVPNTQNDWVDDMIIFLQIGHFPKGLERSKWRYYRLQSIPYCLVKGILFKKDLQGVLLRCIKLSLVDHILYQFHEGLARGDFSPRATALKVMKVGYYWPSVFKDAHSWWENVTSVQFLLEKRG